MSPVAGSVPATGDAGHPMAAPPIRITTTGRGSSRLERSSWKRGTAVKLVDVAWKVVASSLFVLAITLHTTGAPALALTVAPSNPTIVVGQTQQFTSTGSVSATAIAGGTYHVCASRSDGTAQCWGRNNLGQIGNGTLNNAGVPVGVSNVTNASDISLGDEHTCALLSDGRVQCWGVADSGQLGDGTTTGFSAVPVTVSGITTATALTTGAWHSCAVLADGTMQCWGRNIDGQLGDGTTTNSFVPHTVNGITHPAAITAGGYHTCVLMPDTTLLCWGRNDDGQLGNGTWTTSGSPVQVAISGPVVVDGGYFHTCALLSDHTVQ